MAARKLAYETDSWGSVWELVRQRDCDPNPGTYCLWNPGNGAIHSKHNNYPTAWDARDAVNEDDDLKMVKVFQHCDPEKYE